MTKNPLLAVASMVSWPNVHFSIGINAWNCKGAIQKIAKNIKGLLRLEKWIDFRTTLCKSASQSTCLNLYCFDKYTFCKIIPVFRSCRVSQPSLERVSKQGLYPFDSIQLWNETWSTGLSKTNADSIFFELSHAGSWYKSSGFCSKP